VHFAQVLSQTFGNAFCSIITFLLQKIDPTFNVGTAEFDDEVAQVFKLLGYLIKVSQMALAALGLPNTWPALLAVLTWL
jgi:SMC interacting uncharacterized protein involved in chromosome segregation